MFIQPAAKSGLRSHKYAFNGGIHNTMEGIMNIVVINIIRPPITVVFNSKDKYTRYIHRPRDEKCGSSVILVLFLWLLFGKSLVASV